MRYYLLLLALPLAAQPPDRCVALQKHGQWEAAQSCYAALVGNSDPYLRAEGLWGLNRYEEAKNEFKKAMEVHPADPMVRVRWGRLFLQRFNRQDAVQL